MEEISARGSGLLHKDKVRAVLNHPICFCSVSAPLRGWSRHRAKEVVRAKSFPARSRLQTAGRPNRPLGSACAFCVTGAPPGFRSIMTYCEMPVLHVRAK
jgi:hypothetical protein